RTTKVSGPSRAHTWASAGLGMNSTGVCPWPRPPCRKRVVFSHRSFIHLACRSLSKSVCGTKFSARIQWFKGNLLFPVALPARRKTFRRWRRSWVLLHGVPRFGRAGMSQTQGALLLRHIRRLATAQSPSRHADGELLQQFIAGRDEAAFTALVQRHGAMVLGVCRSVLGHQQDAEDAFQATFLVLARKATAIRKRQSISSWLHGVAYRLALKARAQAGKRRAHVKLAERADPASAMDDLTWRELRGILHEELQRLPDKYRAPLLLCYWEGKTRDEAAEQLGWAKGTLKEQLERGRNLLRGRLTRRGLVPSATLFATLLSQSGLQAAMSAGLVENTVTAALQFAAGKVAATGAATLAQGVIHTMHVTQWVKTVLAVVLVAALGAGLGLVTRQALTAEPSDGNA